MAIILFYPDVFHCPAPGELRCPGISSDLYGIDPEDPLVLGIPFEFYTIFTLLP